MIHPLKAATSFECDGCGHHASFHKMENTVDEETVRRWKEIETRRDQEHEVIAGLLDAYDDVREIAPPKRRRIGNGPAKGIGKADAADDTQSGNRVPVRKRVSGE